jgi:hypothetical protein
MKSSMIIGVLALLLSIAGTVKAEDPPLSYRLHQGDTYFLKIDLQQNTHSESIESEEISFYNLTGVEFGVDSIDSSGQIYMSVTYRDLLISMLAPQLEIDISSSSGKNQMLTKMVEMLEKSVFHMVMTPRGELVELIGLEEIFTPLSSLPVADTSEQHVILSTLEEAYGPYAFKSVCNLFVWIYPVIQPMANWTNDITYYFNTKAVEIVNRYYLSKSTEKIAVIQGIGMLNSTNEFFETTDMGEVKSAVSGSQTYDFQVDLESGWLKKCNSRQRVMIETTILKSRYLPSGLKIPSYTETVFEVTGGRLEPTTEPDKR